MSALTATEQMNTFVIDGMKTTATKIRMLGDGHKLIHWRCMHELVPDFGYSIECSIVSESNDYLQLPEVNEHLAAIKRDLIRLKQEQSQA